MLCFLVVAIGAGVFTWLRVTDTIRSAQPLPVPKRPHVAAVVWSQRVFLDDDQLIHWLNVRGSSYRQWARKHRHAAVLLERSRR
jgi:hypothetical protein